MGIEEWAAAVLGEPFPAVGGGPYPACTKGPGSSAPRGDEPPRAPRTEAATNHPSLGPLSARAEKAIALLSLSDAFYLLNRVVEREYRAWKAARAKRGDRSSQLEASRLSALLAKHMDSFIKLVQLARVGHFDLRALEAEEERRLPAFEAIADEGTRRDLLARYQCLLAQEEELLRLVEEAAGAPGRLPAE